MSKVRQRKVSTEVSRILGRLLVSEAKDERFHQATITEVDISPDLGYAKVYVSIRQNTQDNIQIQPWLEDVSSSAEKLFEEDIIEALNKASPWFQRGLGKELRLRKTPKVTFLVDSSAQQYAEIEALLKKALS